MKYIYSLLLTIYYTLFLHSRADIVQRVKSDIKKFDNEAVEAEVDKLLMDAELVNTMIAYEKLRTDPDFVEYSDAPTWRTYANGLFWVGFGFAYFKRVIEPSEQWTTWFPSGSEIDGVTSISSIPIVPIDATVQSAVDVMSQSM